MTSAAISELKASLSKFIHRVRQGEELLVTDRGRPVAKIIPLANNDGGENRRQYLAKIGILELRKRNPSKEFLLPSPIKDPSGSVLKALLEEREEK